MNIEFIPAARDCYFDPSQAQSYYGVPRSMQTIVIHWWNSPAARPSFGGNLNYLLNPPQKYPTANTVIGWDESQNRVRIVDTVQYPNVAFTSGGKINAQSVGIECDPWGTDGQPNQGEILKAIGFRVFKFRQQFGWRVPLSRHRDYQQTACPGNYNLAAIDAEADKWASGAYDPKPPTPAPVTPKITFEKLATPKVYVCNVDPTQLWIFNVSKWADFKAKDQFVKGHQVTVFGKAKHPLGGVYLMTKYSFGNADTTGTPAQYWGFNEKDMVEYVEPPKPTPTPTPEPTPTPTPTPTPVPTPTPQPPTVDENVNWLVKAVKAILAFFGIKV